MTYCVDVITADASRLRNRGLAYAFTSSPYIITAFAGPKAANDVYYGINWRWGFGIFAIVFPIVAAPLYFILKFNLKKAEQRGTYAAAVSGRSWFETIKYYFVEFDSEYLLTENVESPMITSLLQSSASCCSPSVYVSF